MIKQLAIVATMATLLTVVTCVGCESAPIVEPVTPPAILAPSIVSDEPVALFANGDEVTITFKDGTTREATIVDAGPLATWMNDDTGETIVSRVYRVTVVIDGKMMFGDIPEFALTKRD